MTCDWTLARPSPATLYLPVFSGTTYVTIETNLSSGDVPVATQRISPAAAASFARILSPNDSSALRTAPGAHHWRLAYLEFRANKGGYGDIIELGDGSSAQTQASQVPYELALDHLYIHGDPLSGQKRGVALNAAAVTIRGCYISDIKAVGADTQAIGGWNGPGPFLIENNYLEAAGEILLLGGSDPAIPNLVSRDVTIRSNYFSRPLAWRTSAVPVPTNIVGTNASGGSLAPGTYTYNVVARAGTGQGGPAIRRPPLMRSSRPAPARPPSRGPLFRESPTIRSSDAARCGP